MAKKPKPASGIARSLKKSAIGIQAYLDRLERVHGAGYLSARDVTRAYEGAFLAYYTGLERHIERLFLGLVTSRVAPTSRQARVLVQIASDRTAREVIRGNRPFSDWLPIDRTAGRAKTYLSEGRPFDRLRPIDHEIFERMHIVRNAVAHRSNYANSRFKKALIDGKGIPLQQRTPAGYLRGQHTTGQSRLSYFIAQGVDTMDRLCA